jgi:2-C-methyl-D-erythritol 2,4-cyclodiphosphate synthase
MFRIGQSRDIHRLEENGRDFILGGIKIPFSKGNVSHSDGDCLYHAIAESLLGALALGDLGKHFPDNDDKYKNIDSSILVKETMKMVKEKGYHVVNIDTSIILEKPKLKDYIDEMRKNIATLLEIDIDCVSVKAQTNEKVDAVGNNDAVEATSIVLLEK